MKKTLQCAFFLAGMASFPAMAHVGYGGRDFGTFDNTYTTSTRTDQAVTGNYGWMDGTDADYGDSHKLRAYRFTLIESANIKLTFEQATSQVTDHLGNVSTSQLGLLPGFSLYQGLAHIAPMKADHDSADISRANRPDNAEGSFRALTDWSIGNDPGDLNGTSVPASLSFFKYVGHAYDGREADSDGMLDGRVSRSFIDLPAGDYSVFVGGSVTETVATVMAVAPPPHRAFTTAWMSCWCTTKRLRLSRSSGGRLRRGPATACPLISTPPASDW